MNQTEYRNLIKEYTDADGLVCHNRTKEGERGASGNGLLYTSIHMINLVRNDWITEDDKREFSKIVDSCKVFREQWLLNRSPVKTDLNSHDDYTGVSAAFKIMRMPFHASAMLRDFKSKNWVLDNELPFHPRLRAWLGRMPQFVTHIYNCAGYVPPFFNHIFSEVVFYKQGLTSKDTDDDAWLLGYLKATCSNTKGAKYFLEKMKSKFSDKGQGVVERALNNVAHPLGQAFIP